MRITEAEWLDGTDPWVLLGKQWPRKTTDRKLWLFAVACWRDVWGLLGPEERAAVEELERFADLPDGEQTPEGWVAIRDSCCPLTSREEAEGPDWTPDRAVCEATDLLVWTVLSPTEQSILETVRYDIEEAVFEASEAVAEAWRGQLAHHCQLLRHVVGNPFAAPPEREPEWLRWNGGAARAVAGAIYDQRRFDEMPILADALQDAGCPHAEVLNHCREPGEHMRGCWVLDWVLGKHHLA